MEQYKQEFKMEAPLIPVPQDLTIQGLEKHVKQQQTEISTLKRKINRMESSINTLESKLSNIDRKLSN